MSAAQNLRRLPLRCPHCKSSGHVEQELSTTNGRLNVFAKDSTIYRCVPFGTLQDRGCGHIWDEAKRQATGEALKHLQVARSQFLASDDPIIRGHVEEAIELLGAVG